MHRRPRTIDLFCGAGGSSYGARYAGAEIIAGFERWEPAIKTYKVNFPSAKVVEGDICHLSSEAIKQLSDELGEIDMILASPECTNHSPAKGSKEKSEESRATVFEVIRFAQVFRPKWLVIENVTEMKSWHRYHELYEELKGFGYFIKEVPLNAMNFGVPQNRERLFLLCSLIGELSPPASKLSRRAVSSVLDYSSRYAFTPLDKTGRAEATKSRARKAIENVGQNEPFLLVYYGSGTNSNGGWQRLDEPLRTITTVDRFAYVVPNNGQHMMRMLQPEELKLAMGFETDFKLGDVQGLSRRDRIKLMGNGVCPPVMTAIVKGIIEQQGCEVLIGDK